MRFEQIKMCGRHAESIHEEDLEKMRVQIEQQRAQIELLRIQNLEMRATIGEMQDFLRQECV
eukprot:2508363-Heterocapsa_arctica.AAC.1